MNSTNAISSAAFGTWIATFLLRSGAEFTFTPRLSSAAVDGLMYGVRGRFDLSSFGAAVLELSPAITTGPPLNPRWSHRSFPSAPVSSPEASSLPK